MTGERGGLRRPDTRANNLGSSTVLSPGQRATVLRWETVDQDSHTITAQVGFELQPPETGIVPALGDDPRVVGRLSWGIGGATHDAEFDVLAGASVSVAASFAEIIAENIASPTSWRVNVSASIAFGSKAPNGLPTLVSTRQGDPVPIGATVGPFPVARWSTVGIALFRPSNAVAIVNGTRSDGSPLWERSIVSAQSFPIVSGAQFVTVTNPGPVAIASVVFQYALVF